MKATFLYLYEVLKHKYFVIIAGIRIGNIPITRFLMHDISKFSLVEFKAYKKKFILDNCPKNEWDNAWLHHIHHNEHHWQYWILDGKCLPMPEIVIREMVADWMGAGRSYAGDWNDICYFLAKSYKNMRFHPETEKILKRILIEQDVCLPEELKKS